MAKELLFFVMLALTVTSSVQSAGVLVVFALLIAPAYAAIVQTCFKQLLFSWIFGSVGGFGSAVSLLQIRSAHRLYDHFCYCFSGRPFCHLSKFHSKGWLLSLNPILNFQIGDSLKFSNIVRYKNCVQGLCMCCDKEIV